MKGYGIKLKGERYLKWYNDNWYETSEKEMYIFKTMEEAENAFKFLIKHYVYDGAIEDTDGNVTECHNYLAKPKINNTIKSFKITIKA